MTHRLKMVLGIGTILLVVIVAYAVIALMTLASHVRDVTRREAELIAAVTERAIARAMTEGKSNQVQAILEEIGRLPYLAGVRITDLDGTILRSSRPEETGQTLPRRSGFADPRAWDTAWDRAEQTVSTSHPILNRPPCYACHSPHPTTLGTIDVRLTVPSVESQLARRWSVMVLPAILALLGAGGSIAVYFTLVLGRRITTLSHGMNRVEEGDLTTKVPEDDRDELGRLGRSFNVMVARLADAQRQLEDRHATEIRRAEHLAALGKMAAGIAHEINNPLAGMQNCVRTLSRGARDERQRVQYLELLQEGLGRIGRTVGQLLNFARESPPRLTRTDLASVIERSLALVEHEMAARKITCSRSVDPGLPALLADPRQLEQVFLNLLMNALEAMPTGGTLTIGTGWRQRGTDLCVEARVSDTGGGILPGNLSRIFDPFFTTKEVGRGTGLGLSVSYGIVRAHGGVIDVQSEVGQGSTFSVILPVRKEGGDDVPPGSPGGR
ncbi:MAG: HAMP domain-containing protein [Candidatus Rokubacteria bacterium]|nr:HAMP domain-containing protein [Candidatus Rokubacteria bacterium]